MRKSYSRTKELVRIRHKNSDFNMGEYKGKGILSFLELSDIKGTLLVLIVLFISLMLLLSLCFSAECQESEESYELEMDMAIHINNLFIDNSTAKIDLYFWIRNFPEKASNVYVLFPNIEHYELNCTYQGGGPSQYQFQGKLEGKSWYLEGFGALFPFDFYILTFELYPYHLQYKLNETIYGLRYWNYTFVEEHSQVYFSGLYRVRLENEWKIFPYFADGTCEVYLFRKEEMPQYQFLFPLILIQALITFSPSLTNDRSLRIRLYSSTLIFSPMFVFAIQDFLPYRTTLSIPEFLGVNLIFFSTIMIFASLPINPENKKPILSAILDVSGIVGACIWYYLVKTSVYRDITSLLYIPHVKPVFDIILILFFVGIFLRLFMAFKTKLLSLLCKSLNKAFGRKRKRVKNSMTK